MTRFALEHPDWVSSNSNTPLCLSHDQDGLCLEWQVESRTLSFRLDFVSKCRQQKSFPSPKQGAFNQAIGKHTKTVLDMSAGWGGDALLLCMQGYQVSMVERLPLLHLLLIDAFERLNHSEWAQRHAVSVPKPHLDESNNFIETIEMTQFDCFYFDPMFPAKRKKSAQSNKYMQLLQAMKISDSDGPRLVKSLLEKGARRVVVKRPDYAKPLAIPTSMVFSSKLVHYDVYLAN